jgi:hypothetical protein
LTINRHLDSNSVFNLEKILDYLIAIKAGDDKLDEINVSWTTPKINEKINMLKNKRWPKKKEIKHKTEIETDNGIKIHLVVKTGFVGIQCIFYLKN